LAGGQAMKMHFFLILNIYFHYPVITIAILPVNQNIRILGRIMPGLA
jgi:hypothetical protein